MTPFKMTEGWIVLTTTHLG